MKVQNPNCANTPIRMRDGSLVTGNADGVFEVSDEVGRSLIKTPGWKPVGRAPREAFGGDEPPPHRGEVAGELGGPRSPQEPAQPPEPPPPPPPPVEPVSEAQEGGDEAPESPADLDLPAEVTGKRARKPSTR